MSFTLSTIPLLLLSLYLWHCAKGQLLPVVMFMSVFMAASVVNVGLSGTTLGIGASYLLLVVAILKQLGSRPDPGTALHRPKESTSLLVFIFAVYAVVGSFLFPFIFKGVLITNPKFGFLVPLVWSTGTVPQLIYLVVSIALYFVAAYKTTPAELSKALNWYVGGAVLASVIAMFQYVCMKTGLPFPKELFHTNPTYGIFQGYEVNGFPRMNATFPEASSAAFTYASALALSLWNLLSGQMTLRRLTITLVVLVGLLLTISTTGYLCLIFIVVVAGWYYISTWKGSGKKRAARIVLGVPAFAAVLIALAVPDARESFDSLLRTVILDKTKTFSYEQRTQMNDDAYSTAAQTYFLGAGWGVCRASSIIPTMLGNVGLPGFLLLICCAFQPFIPILKRQPLKGRIHGAVLFCFGTIIVDLIIAGPELTAPIIWFLLAVASRLSRIKPMRVPLPQLRSNIRLVPVR